MVKLYKGISINGFQSLSQDSSSYFNRELLVTDKARSISKQGPSQNFLLSFYQNA